MISIRPAEKKDNDAVWRILEPVFRAGDTYTLPTDISRVDALSYWLNSHHLTFVAEDNEDILGTYILRANQQGNGDHVCNCGYVTAKMAEGRGVARAMLEHSLEKARDCGYLAMQFNFVVGTNERAITTWKRYGFDIVGTLPHAFRHPVHGLVDAHIMYKKL